ncbi:MAG: thioredoxin, partial [Clostridia bacterium]|nr:thioredoxin [Clostridia bacterium]
MAAIINKENFENLVLKSEKTVLLDFYADWCGPCRTLMPVIEQIS